MNYINDIAIRAKKSVTDLRKLSTKEKNNVLINLCKKIKENKSLIFEKNKIDIENAIEQNYEEAFIDRLTLNENRISSMIESIKQIATLKDPIGEILKMDTLENGLIIGKKRTNLGVVGIIYESRPNVTSDAFSLCFKTSNVTILRGGKEAIETNKVIVNIIRDLLKEMNFNENFIQLIENLDREVTINFMKLNEYVDVLIPRGSSSLIKSVIENSSIPVIETGVGNCHIFVDESTNLTMAKDIVINAKTQRPGVCNALETLLIHKNISEKFIPLITKELKKHAVVIRGDEATKKLSCEDIEIATEEDYKTEFSSLIIAIKVVENLDEAIYHIEKYSSGHSEAIITENYTNSQIFLNQVDSAAVYVNASTRFTDGFEFGLGGEIGISTQKLHARGPMGLEALTTTKYIIFGSGQIRE